MQENLKYIKTMDATSITFTDLADPENLTTKFNYYKYSGFN